MSFFHLNQIHLISYLKMASLAYCCQINHIIGPWVFFYHFDNLDKFFPKFEKLRKPRFSCKQIYKFAHDIELCQLSITFLVVSHDSIRGGVRPSVGPSVGR